MDSPGQYLEGSPTDAAILTGLLLAGILVLVARRRRFVGFMSANRWIILFLFYCLVSVLWSDYPLVAFKRWSKFLGNVTMVLIVLTDTHPAAAIKRLFARTGFLLIPISMLLIKYYPALGRGYSQNVWRTFYSGVSTDKNGLGAVCLVFGLASLWRFVEAIREKTNPGRIGSIVAHGTILGITLWLLYMANSSTSTVCFALGGAVVLIGARMARRPATIHAIVAATATVGVLSFIFDDAWTAMVHALGRETNLTGRTDIWNDVLNLHVNPVIGTGFESFWLGARAEYFWSKYVFHPNEAHNGYLEVFLNEGWIGVVLLALVIVFGYRSVVAAFRQNLPWATLMLSFLAISAIYNITEAAFKVIHPVFIAFLFAVIVVPKAPDVEDPRLPCINHSSNITDQTSGGRGQCTSLCLEDV